jgi:hypothetical protein
MPRLGKTSIFENTGVLKNKKNSRTLQDATECDPTADADPATGILQCGTSGLFCVPSETSTLGGLCTTYGEYFDYQFDLLCTDEAYNCDCSGLNITARSGTFNCTPAFCTDDNCDFCISAELTSVIEGYSTPSKSECTTLLVPYEQSYCYTVFLNSTCEISIGGITCNSCEYSTYDCTTFDCSNTGDKGQKGNLCTDSLLPVLEEFNMIVNDDDFEPAIATCKDILSPKDSGAAGEGSAGAAGLTEEDKLGQGSAGDGAAGLSGKIGSILAASTFATIMVVGYLIA